MPNLIGIQDALLIHMNIETLELIGNILIVIVMPIAACVIAILNHWI